MKRKRYFYLVLILALAWPAFDLGACSGSCSTDAQCSANPCRYCDTGPGACGDCCEYTEIATCPAACTWDAPSAECRNEASTSCVVSVPELPQSKSGFWLMLLLTALAMGYQIYRTHRAPLEKKI